MSHSSRFLAILSLSLFASIAAAHDPKEHAREAAAAKAGPDCAALNQAGASSAEANDVVAQALKARCANVAGESSQGDSKIDANQGDGADDAHSNHAGDH